MKIYPSQQVCSASRRDSPSIEPSLPGHVEKETEGGGFVNLSKSQKDSPSAAWIALQFNLSKDGDLSEGVANARKHVDVIPTIEDVMAPQNLEEPPLPNRIFEPQPPKITAFVKSPQSLAETQPQHPTLPDQDGYASTSVKSTAHCVSDGEDPHARAELLNILDTTQSVSRAWDAYQNLMALPRDGSRPPIPWSHLHRLTRLLASTKPRTRTHFICLLTVISTIHKTGGRVSLWQWNALVDFAGKGWRKTRQEDFMNAVGVFNDLVTHRPPGATFSRSRLDAPSSEDTSSPPTERPTPDVITYTTLLNIAGRTLHAPTFQHASVMFDDSGVKPNRITLLSKLRYFTRRGELSGVRATISQLRQNNFDLGLDGINACLWAFGRNERLDVASAIYEVLKSRLWNPQGEQDENVVAFKTFLDTHEGIKVPDGILPDRITFTALLQCFAYHGDLMQSLQVFMDMITFMEESSGANSEGERGGLLQVTFMLPAYRAIFLGFVRHAKARQQIEVDERLSNRLQTKHLRTNVDQSVWSLDALEALFRDFLGLPEDARPSERLIYWILVAFARCTGDDLKKLREVYTRLEERFGGEWGWGGRLARMKRRLFRDA